MTRLHDAYVNKFVKSFQKNTRNRGWWAPVVNRSSRRTQPQYPKNHDTTIHNQYKHSQSSVLSVIDNTAENILRAVCQQSVTIQQRTFSEECANSQWQYSREHSQRRVLTVSDNTAENILRAVCQQSVTIPQSSFDQYQQWLSVRFLSWKPVTVNSAPDTLY